MNKTVAWALTLDLCPTRHARFAREPTPVRSGVWLARCLDCGVDFYCKLGTEGDFDYAQEEPDGYTYCAVGKATT